MAMSISKKLLGSSGGYFRAISCRNHAGLSLGISATCPPTTDFSLFLLKNVKYLFVYSVGIV